MARVTNEALFEMIKSIKEDTTEIKLNDKEQWKEINKNGQNISGIKAIGGLISLCVAGMFAFFGAKQ